MKRLLAFTLIALLPAIDCVAHAQAATPCVETAKFLYVPRVFFNVDIHETFSKAIINIPAKFPNPARTSKVDRPFTMTCKSFKAVATKTSLSITGGTAIANIRRIASENTDGDPDLTQPQAGRIILAYNGYFYYPNIREDWTQERIFFDIKEDKIQVWKDWETDRPFWLKDIVVGVKVNGGPLQPVYFENKVTQIKHDLDDLVEIYTKGEYAEVDYVSINFKTGAVTLRNGVAFPAR